MFSKTDIEKYFVAEKQESLLFLAIGIIAILLAIVFVFAVNSQFYKGASVSLLCVGLILGVVGYTVYTRSDNDRIKNVYAYDMNPGDLKEKELPRMEKVMKSFVLYRYVEIFLAITGIVLFFYFRTSAEHEFWKGLGMALAIMAIIALGADYFAEKRGHEYINGLRAFINKNN
ncbi:MAG: hypothetical protein QM725_15125 [Lacibacter sp.]